MRLTQISLLLTVALIVGGCESILNSDYEYTPPPEIPNPDISSYPTTFENIESDIVYEQENSLFLINHITQETSQLSLPPLEHGITHQQWSADGQKIYFLDLDYNFWDGGDNGQLYQYDMVQASCQAVGAIQAHRLYLSPYANDQLIYSVQGDYDAFGVFKETEHYLYNIQTQMAISIDEKLTANYQSDTTEIYDLHVSQVSFTSANDFNVDFWVYISQQDSIISADLPTAFFSYSGTDVHIDDIRNTPYRQSLFSPDSSFYCFVNSSSSHPGPGTFLVEVASSDTINLNTSTIALTKFFPNSSGLLFTRSTENTSLKWSYNIWLVDLGSKAITNLFEDAYHVSDISLSRSGNQILMTAKLWGSEYNENIWIMNSDGSFITLLSEPHMTSGNPIFRP